MRIFKKRTCAICGEAIGLLACRLAQDVNICTACETLLRGRYTLVRQGAAWRDPLHELDLSVARQTVDDLREAQRSDLKELGSRYAHILHVADTFPLPGTGLEAGGDRIAALGGRTAALCFCVSGVFCQGDRVTVLAESGETLTSVEKLVPCTGAYPLEEYLITGAYKPRCTANADAWLILADEGVRPGDRIVKPALPDV